MTISSDNSLLSRGAVMACTQQSAVEYIKNARVILVEQLKNQPLIVEKLREKEVLNLHQCTEINEEPKTFEKNRKILDFVTSKGNKACYELLRVLNTTRQRTLPKPTGQQKDLHHWISCFPFTEDQEMEPSLGSKACQEYQKQLRREAQKILQASVRQKKCLGGDAAPEAFCYTPLVLDPDTDHNSVTSKIQTKSKKYKKSRPKKLKSFIPKAQGQLSPEDLLWGEKNLIVLVGKPGIGKSTVTHQMLHLWCERQNGGLDYLFYLDDRLLSTSTPAQLESLFDSYVEPRESREEVYEDITEHSENVTIIFDGLTDVLLHPLLEKIITKSILEDARIVITCRPEQLFDLSERIDPHVVHVQGFSEESIRTYLTEKLSDQPDAVASVVEHLELFSLCHVPLHAFMVAVCISFLSREADRSWNVTEIHLHIFRQIIMKCENVSMRNIDGWIRKHGEQILSLAEIARNATLQKTLDIRDHEASGIQCHFLKSLSVMDTPTSVRNHSAFLNSSMQDFFGALWLLCHPAEIDAFLQKCWTEEGKHLKYTIPFLCGFMSERNIPLLKGLVPKTQIQLASDCFHEKLLRLLFEPEGDQHFEKSEEEELSNIADDEDLLFHCQCLYESQSPEACLQFLERLKWHLDLSGSHLDPHQCCTLAYVISQSKEQKVHLELKKCRISDPGVKMILGCSQHFSSASTLCHVWLHVLSSEDPRDFTGLLAACGNELHLPVGEQPTIFKNAGGILRRSPGKINLCLHWDTTTHHLSKALWTVIFSEFPHIHSIRLNLPLEDQNLRLMSLHQDLCVLGAEFFFQILYGLHSSHKTPAEMGLFLMDLYSSLMKSFLPALQPVYQPASPAVWTIELSERKTSIFLEVLKMQTEKKPVELRGWSDEGSEVRSFLQSLKYISHIGLTLQNFSCSVEQDEIVKMFLLNLCLQSAHYHIETVKTTVETLMVLFREHCKDRSSFLLDLCSHVKNYESQTGRSFLPALQPVYQSASPAVWTIDLSERKTSIFLEVLKMQTEKKPVELRGWSDEESEVRSFLQCLNYVSQLRFPVDFGDFVDMDEFDKRRTEAQKVLLNLIIAAVKWDAATGESFCNILTSVCSYKTFPLGDGFNAEYLRTFQSNFLHDLYSHVKNYESQTGRSFLPALQPVYQSAAPAVWTIDLSERKASIFLEVLKMQIVKKPVELRGWSDEESEVRSFLQCLNYVSQLRFDSYLFWRYKSGPQFLLNLFTAAAEWDAATGESFSKILTSVCSYKTFPRGDDHFHDNDDVINQSDFLLDLYSHVKNYESQTGRSFLPALQPVYQSAAPAVWTIYLSERKTSIFLEVLKMQTEKKPVELRGWSDEESEVRSFLQCLNYVSQLRFYVGYDDERRKKAVQVLLNLITAAAEWDADTGESFSKILTSVCSYKTFPRGDDHFGDDDDDVIYHSDFLLDLCSHVKNYESQTGRSFLPALQPVYQSASPAVWTIDLSERKASIFLEVLKMQPEKKPVKLRGWSDEESEVRSFLQCLKYVSQLSGADEFFPAVCKAVGPRQVEQVTPLLQAMGFTLTLGGDLSSHCCRSVGRVLGLSASRLDLTLQPEHISLRGTRLIFKHIHTLHKLRLNKKMLFRITRALRSQGGCSSFTIEELSFIQPEGALSSVMSSMVLLLRHWTVRCLDLTACQIEAQSVTGLLMYQGLLTIRLSAESLQLLTLLVYEAHEEELTQHFLQKVSGDLTSCSLNWEVIHYLLQVKGPPITVDFRRNKMTLQNIRDIFPHGNRVMIKRLPPRFLMVIMREIYETRAAHCVSSLLKWSEKNIVLNSRVQDAADCAALCFTLQHSEGVQLSLLWSSIPEGALENILLLLNNVSLLSVDRKLLLRLLHCCFSSELQQGAAAALLRSLQHRLNFSCDSAVDLTGPTDGQVLVLGHEDCMVVSMVIQRSSVAVELSLHDCEIEDAGLQQFFPILHKICLSCSKALLLHFLSLLSGGSEAESVKCAESLSQALGGEVDLSQTPVDPGVCGSIALLLEYSEGLSELDLSHCQLTDRCLELLLPHLQKTRVLDLSHNNITDCMTERLYSIISASSNLHTVRLFNNKIKDKKLLVTDRRVEIW
ncbi:uncharacterized protein LOC114796725 isoform X7 [Denticeps clupeoides]|uniref:uncharacterized protein LOC114796725 isoform X7 n=1 Tax=Denticeps clupeoides TaxID=299321 RepID=UPI0010A2D0C5|nr:uncharacterized protein LOC114796725 isoform X7 [Denticeps clupeoides]